MRSDPDMPGASDHMKSHLQQDILSKNQNTTQKPFYHPKPKYPFPNTEDIAYATEFLLSYPSNSNNIAISTIKREPKEPS
jgi:hypothetical protein